MVAKSTIMVVDPSMVIQEMIADALPTDEFAVMAVSTREEAAEMIRAESPAVVLLARLLPDSSGTELIQELQQDVWTFEIPVLFITSSRSRKDVATAIEAGAVDYLLKPFSQDEIREKVRAIVENQLTASS